MSDEILSCDLSWGELMEPAMCAQTQEAADAYLERMAERCMRCFGYTREDAIASQRQNIGYFAGYHSHETRLRVERLFQTQHPILGRAEDGDPTPQEAFEAGMRWELERQARRVPARMRPRRVLHP